MDDFPHASRNDATAGHFGFYDAGWHIAILPKLVVRPEVVIDHEVTHVNITDRSGFGILERYCLFLSQLAVETGSEVLGTLAADVLRVLRVEGTRVHEAVAWLDSELITTGKEGLVAPPAHADGVRILRDLFRSVRGSPFETIRAGWKPVMTISESIAIHALSPPAVQERAEAPAGLDARDLANQIRRPTNNPFVRFSRLCKTLEGRSFDDLWAWSESVQSYRPAALGDQRRGFLSSLTGSNVEPPAWVPPPETFDEDVVKWAHELLRHLGIRVGSSEDETRATLASAWLQYRSLYVFASSIDRYAQTCVIEIPRLRKRDLIKAPEGLRPFNAAPFLVVSVTHALGFQTPDFIPDSGVMIAFEAQEGIIPTWVTDDPSARYYIETNPSSTAVLATSVSYDFARGDYAGREILSDVPHAVVSVSDFRSLWQRLAIISETGLAGTRLIEWQSIWMDRGGGVFGYLLLKPSGKPSPIVVNPTMIDRLDRVMSVADDIPSPYGTALIESFVDLDAWLGELAPAVGMATAQFSSET